MPASAGGSFKLLRKVKAETHLVPSPHHSQSEDYISSGLTQSLPEGKHREQEKINVCRTCRELPPIPADTQALSDSGKTASAGRSQNSEVERGERVSREFRGVRTSGFLE